MKVHGNSETVYNRGLTFSFTLVHGIHVGSSTHNATMQYVQNMMKHLDMAGKNGALAANNVFHLWDVMKTDPKVKPNLLTYLQLMRACVMSKHRYVYALNT